MPVSWAYGVGNMHAESTRWGILSSVVVFILVFVIITLKTTASDRLDFLNDKRRTADMAPVLDGSFVHNIGELQLNVTNWGIIGSLPNSNYPMRDVPSAQYPAGSETEYLYAAGIWVGALQNGIPCVSTGYPEDEFRPGMDSQNTIYETFEGDTRGAHLPAAPDDDMDGIYDEDPLNGYDDDRDGKIDEDFAAFGNQMFCCEYFDNKPQCSMIWPEHNQMELKISQETFQWGEDVYNDFVVARYTVTNIGFEYLSDVYVGIYADLDAGARGLGTYHLDDQVGFWSGEWCAPWRNAEFPVNINIAYVHDADGDNGKADGYFGIAIITPNHLINSFRIFQGMLPYMNGGEPTNDFERYDVMAERAHDENTQTPGDYRCLLSLGPFPYIGFNNSVEIALAFVAGKNFDELRKHAAAAQMIYRGVWYDLDEDPTTGIIGRETKVWGPIERFDPDFCDGIPEELYIPKFTYIWANVDCRTELYNYNHRKCYRDINAVLRDYQTGLDGKEYNLHWITGGVSPPPRIRVVPGDHQVTIYWDNLSETVPDLITGFIDFEGYQIWRADDWHRPLGSSKDNGPAIDLWSLMEARDLVNGVFPNINFKSSFESGGWEYTPLLHLDRKEIFITAFKEALIYSPLDSVPCPPGLTPEECDTIEAVARFDLGYEGGLKYYKFVDDTAKNGLPYFYSVVAYDHAFGKNWVPDKKGRMNSPSASFAFTVARSQSQEADEYDETEVYAVPNPVTSETMSGWALGPTNSDPSGMKVEIRNLPACKFTLRIFTIAGDLVQTLHHNGSAGNGTVVWNLVSRNGQDVTSGVYIFAVEPEDSNFERTIGKFVVIR